MTDVLVLGLGYTAAPFAAKLASAGCNVAGTTRSPSKAMQIAGTGVSPLVWGAGGNLPRDRIEEADLLVVSTPPGDDGCPALHALQGFGPRPFIRAPQILYLSSSGVYGDHGGGWVDEEMECRPGTERGKARLAAERTWADFAEENGATLTLCRLAGIYGPGRSAVDSLSGDTTGARAGLTRRLEKPGHVFNRIHRDDIVRGLYALAEAENPPAIVNFADDEPSPPADPITFAAELLGIEPPPLQRFEDIEEELSPMARSFYAESKRLGNGRLRELVGTLTYPTYREGLRAIAEMRRR
ncbi:SDR family oxidoreductase [Parvularcula maris]|uniref:SDR family oxidoreductase n=1 Tax=Parvularcula maris TaxID=2965077 RepID=A0A9X2L6A9_9PROT|nr:SDR family oxidoreductase [Parvularcula maris]MCQ8183878.1 SDR family oxidoreductase [Parvularcula maris]